MDRVSSSTGKAPGWGQDHRSAPGEERHLAGVINGEQLLGGLIKAGTRMLSAFTGEPTVVALDLDDVELNTLGLSPDVTCFVDMVFDIRRSKTFDVSAFSCL